MGKGGTKGAIKKLHTNPIEGAKFMADPGGLFYQSKDKDINKLQAGLDVGNIGAKPRRNQQLANAEEEEYRKKVRQDIYGKVNNESLLKTNFGE
jgi:hypothetical protein